MLNENYKENLSFKNNMNETSTSKAITNKFNPSIEQNNNQKRLQLKLQLQVTTKSCNSRHWKN